jgi:hypothetical protein
MKIYQDLFKLFNKQVGAFNRKKRHSLDMEKTLYKFGEVIFSSLDFKDVKRIKRECKTVGQKEKILKKYHDERKMF